MRNKLWFNTFKNSSAAQLNRMSFGDSHPGPNVMAPALLLDVPLESTIMRHEIFGPALPVLEFSDHSTVIKWLQHQDKPLAICHFGRDQHAREQLLAATSSGGASLNGWAVHFADSRLPFGGIGTSGMGRYHGVHGFRELSHARSVLVA
jgi:aldehyde dehydrogenase (NAD+)